MVSRANFTRLALPMMCLLPMAGVWAYGGGGSSSGSCPEPQFYDESPPRNAKIASVAEISMVASDNTDPSTLELEINGKRLQPDISRRRSGEWSISQRLPEVIAQPGKVRITVAAKSKEGCSTFHPYYLELAP